VVWSGSRTGYTSKRIYGARVTASGSVLDANGVALSPAGWNQDEPAVAFNGTDYFVVWTQNADIYGTRVTPSLTVRDTASIVVSNATGSQSSPAVAALGA